MSPFINTALWSVIPVILGGATGWFFELPTLFILTGIAAVFIALARLTNTAVSSYPPTAQYALSGTTAAGCYALLVRIAVLFLAALWGGHLFKRIL